MITSPMAIALRTLNRLYTPEKPLTFSGKGAMIKVFERILDVRFRKENKA